jgi:hypothetical protein
MSYSYIFLEVFLRATVRVPPKDGQLNISKRDTIMTESIELFSGHNV